MNVSTELARIAVVGFPNVGKSTLVNRLCGTREAVVHSQAGVTRDRKEVETDWNGIKFLLVDTGGIDEQDTVELSSQVQRQARLAVEESRAVVLVVDARIGTTPGDEELASWLRGIGKPVTVVANKVDSNEEMPAAADFYRLGFGEPLAVSAAHGLGTGDLLDRLAEIAGEGQGVSKPETKAPRVAVLGRPNVGKSSLVNAFAGEERVVVHDKPGTTRDAIDTRLEVDGTELILVDTAGLRRKSKTSGSIDYYSQLRSERAAERADIALVVCDAEDGVTSADLKIADLAMRSGCAVIVVLNKWDIHQADLDFAKIRIEKKMRLKPKLVTASAKTGRNLSGLLQDALTLFERYKFRVSTAELNRFVTDVQEEKQPPAVGGRRLKIYYMTQVETGPSKFNVYINDRRRIQRDYGFFFENRLRERYKLEGVPLIIDFRGKEGRREGGFRRQESQSDR